MELSTQEKLLFHKLKREIKHLKGLDVIDFVTEKPSPIKWYNGELNSINNDIPVINEFTLDVDIKVIAECIEKQTIGEKEFVVAFEVGYLIFKINSFLSFLKSLYLMTKSRDITLFFYNQSKVVEVFSAEYEIEVKAYYPFFPDALRTNSSGG